jgi:hypothetical protein
MRRGVMGHTVPSGPRLCTCGRLASENTTGSPRCRVHALQRVFRFRLSPKGAMSPEKLKSDNEGLFSADIYS